MKNVIRVLMVFLFVFSLGCQTMQAGGSGGSSSGHSAAAPASSSNGKMLTDEDYKRIGVKETYENR